MALTSTENESVIFCKQHISVDIKMVLDISNNKYKYSLKDYIKVLSLSYKIAS